MAPLHDAATDGALTLVKRLLADGVKVDAKDDAEFESTALMLACSGGHAAVVKALLEAGADVEAKNGLGLTALMQAAVDGHVEIARILLAQGADTESKDTFNYTAADIALDSKHPMVYSLLRPEEARRRGDELRKQFDEAPLVHVISTRFQRDRLESTDRSCDPWQAAMVVKEELEGDYVLGSQELLGTERAVPLTGARVFNPNSDNAFLMGGDSEQANAIWLRNWRTFLEMARRKGGRCIQVIVPPGLSHMQHAEADMAADKGVPLVVLDLTEKHQPVIVASEDLVQMHGWQELVELAAQVRRGEALPVPMSREEQSREIEAQRRQMDALRVQPVAIESTSTASKIAAARLSRADGRQRQGCTSVDDNTGPGVG